MDTILMKRGMNKMQASYESFRGLTLEETKSRINDIIDYFIAEGLIIEDPTTKKIRLITEEEFQQQIEDAYNE